MAQSFLENESTVLICMCLAIFRIAIEIYGVDLKLFPLAKKYPVMGGNIHRYGLYMSIGYVILFAPELLLS